jgi:2-alkyl-3-oxoalkanoate reductase
VRALVTGAAGFVGSHLVQELLQRGDDVTAVVRPGSPFAPQAEVRLLSADLRAPGAAIAAALPEADAVYHVAASSSGTWRTMFDANVAATERLVADIAQTGWRGRFVHVSSFSVYGLNQLRSGATVDEDVPLEPEPGRRDDYAWTKVLQERVVRRLADADGVEPVIVRPGAVYGRERQFQHRIGRQIGSGVVLLIGGGNLIPLSYVENTASLLAECGRHPAAAGEVFNAVDPHPLTQWQYLRRWLAAQRHPVHVVPVPATAFAVAGRLYEASEKFTAGAVSPPLPLRPYAAAPTMRSFRYAPSRAERVLGWRAPVPLHEALERTFDEANVG